MRYGVGLLPDAYRPPDRAHGNDQGNVTRALLVGVKSPYGISRLAGWPDLGQGTQAQGPNVGGTARTSLIT